MAGHFTEELSITPLDGGDRWRVNDDFVWHIGHRNSLLHVIVPGGFIYDLASVPRPLRLIVPHTTAPQASALHDFGYRYNQVHVVSKYVRGFPVYHDILTELDRSDWDRAFYDGMKAKGISTLRARMAYGGVAVGGGSTWSGHRERNLKWDYE